MRLRIRIQIIALSVCAIAILAFADPSHAIDFYEIQIYDTDTEPVGHLMLELHSNTTTTATGESAKSAMVVHQIHETLDRSFSEIDRRLGILKLASGIPSWDRKLRVSIQCRIFEKLRRVWSGMDDEIAIDKAHVGQLDRTAIIFDAGIDEGYVPPSDPVEQLEIGIDNPDVGHQ
jgi:hypothetical protein